MDTNTIATPKMNPELKAKWIVALRSGDYKQSKGSLKNQGGYCCLGVLCEVAGCLKTPHPNGDRINFTDSHGCTSSSLLPGGLAVQAAVSGIEVVHLIDLNDAYNKSFSQIADYIEANL